MREHAACNAHVRAWQQRNNMPACSFGLAIRATLVHTSACTSVVRAKNTADDESVVKLLRSNMTSLGDGFKSSCMDTVLASYESFLLDFLLISSRFSAAQLSRCAGKAFEGVCDKDCGLFGRQLSHALSYARVKSKSLTSGAKTHKSTRRITSKLSASRRMQSSCPSQACMCGVELAKVLPGRELRRRKLLRLLQGQPPASLWWR